MDVQDSAAVLSRLESIFLKVLESVRNSGKLQEGDTIFEKEMPDFLKTYMIKFLLLFGDHEEESVNQDVVITPTASVSNRGGGDYLHHIKCKFKLTRLLVTCMHGQ